MAKTLGPRLLPRLLHEETDLDRLDEDPVRVVSETLQLDAAGACLFSYHLKAEPDGYSDGLCRTYAPIAPSPSHDLSTLQFNLRSVFAEDGRTTGQMEFPHGMARCMKS